MPRENLSTNHHQSKPSAFFYEDDFQLYIKKASEKDIEYYKDGFIPTDLGIILKTMHDNKSACQLPTLINILIGKVGEHTSDKIKERMEVANKARTDILADNPDINSKWTPDAISHSEKVSIDLVDFTKDSEYIRMMGDMNANS